MDYKIDCALNVKDCVYALLELLPQNDIVLECKEFLDLQEDVLIDFAKQKKVFDFTSITEINLLAEQTYIDAKTISKY